MTTVLEGARLSQRETDNRQSAPYTAGLLLCELLEAVEVLENHAMEDNEFSDTGLAVQVIANLATRIRKQALAEGLVRALGNRDGSCGRLSIGQALMDADKASAS